MKSLLTLFVVFTTAFNVFALPQGNIPPEVHQEMMRKLDICSKKTGVNPNTLTPEKMAEENPEQEVKCFHACMAKESNLIKDDGTISKEALLDFPPNMPEDIKTHLTKKLSPCADLKGDNECETGFLLFKCMSAPHSA